MFQAFNAVTLQFGAKPLPAIFFIDNDYKIMKIRVSSRKTGTRIPKDHFM